MTTIKSEDAFAEWLAEMQPALAGFEDFAMPVGMPRGFTRESLVALEAFLLDRWPDERAYVAGVDPSFADGAGRYLGEAYLRLAGGGWHVRLQDGVIFAWQPVVLTEVSEGVPLAPYSLITAALHRRTGTEFGRVHDNLVRRVEERRATLSEEWQPSRLPVPGITAGTGAHRSEVPEEQAWVESVEQRIDALRQRLGDEVSAGLDLSPTSLPAVEQAALADLGRTDVDEHAPSDVQQQYVAYLGAVLLRAAGGRWIFRPGDPDTNMYLGNPYVQRTDRDGDDRSEVPLHALDRLLEHQEPGAFSEALADYEKEY